MNRAVAEEETAGARALEAEGACVFVELKAGFHGGSRDQESMCFEAWLETMDPDAKSVLLQVGENCGLWGWRVFFILSHCSVSS